MNPKYLRISFSFFVLVGLLGGYIAPVYSLGDVKINSSSSFHSSATDALLVFGEVENIGDVAAKSIMVTAKFFDSSNQKIAIQEGYTDLDILHPGRKSPFWIILDKEDGSLNVHNYTLFVSWTNFPRGQELGLEIFNIDDYVDILGDFTVTGEIENQGTVRARSVKAIVTFYDSSGVVVGSAWEYTDPEDLEPSQRGNFEVYFIYTGSVEIATYSISAESLEYGLIAEFPSWIILPLFMMATLLAVTIYRKKLK